MVKIRIQKVEKAAAYFLDEFIKILFLCRSNKSLFCEINSSEKQEACLDLFLMEEDAALEIKAEEVVDDMDSVCPVALAGLKMKGIVNYLRNNINTRSEVDPYQDHIQSIALCELIISVLRRRTEGPIRG